MRSTTRRPRLVRLQWMVVSLLAVQLAACGASHALTGTPATAARATATLTGSGLTLYGALGDLYAIHASDGTVRWSLHGAGHFRPPAVVGSALFTAAETPTGTYVYSLNIADRSVRWRQHLSHPVVSPVVAVNGVLYVGLGMAQKSDPSYGAVCALRAADGALLWCHQVDAPVWAAPVVEGSTIYAGSTDDAVYALRVSDGSQIWRYQTGNAVWTPCAVEGGTVYFTAYDHFLYAVRAGTGALLWRHEVGRFPSAPSAAAGVVFVGSDNHTLYAFRSQDGSPLWSAPTGGQVGDPLVVGDKVYVGADDGSVYAFQSGTGALVWRAAFGGQTFSLAAADGVLYGAFTSPPVMIGQEATGGTFAVRPADGHTIWQNALQVGSPIIVA